MSVLDERLPFEVGLEKAKMEIIDSINTIGQKYAVPSSVLAMILENIVKETKLNNLSSIIAAYNIEIPDQTDAISAIKSIGSDTPPDSKSTHTQSK